MGKKSVLLVLILALSATLTFAESFRMGFSAGVELWNRPTYQDILMEFDSQANLVPGWYWEVLIGNVGFGMSSLLKFERIPAALDGLNYLWYLDWIASWDLRYHFFRSFPLDPFLEAGFGSAGRVDITDYEEHGLPGIENPLALSLFGQVGGGLALRLHGIHAGARLLWRFLNGVPPATQFEPYPLKNFRFDLFGGFSF